MHDDVSLLRWPLLARRAKPPPTSVYRLRVELEGLEPAIWRRVLVPDSATLAQLHRVMQIAMGWTDSHLHEFDIGGVRYGVPSREWDNVDRLVNEKRSR